MKTNTNQTSYNQKNQMNNSSSNNNNNKTGRTNTDKRFYDSYKYEVANELGVTMGPDATARQNGSVGGQITKELVAKGKENLDTTNMKYEFADELGVEMGPEATSRQNGSVGGSITKTLVNRGKNSMQNKTNNQ